MKSAKIKQKAVNGKVIVYYRLPKQLAEKLRQEAIDDKREPSVKLEMILSERYNRRAEG